MKHILVVGAGVGGLTTAAALARAGLEVTVLESHIYPGGCAGTFEYQGYRFDAGATLAGGFHPGGPMDRVAKRVGIESWPVQPVEIALVAHLPDGRSIERRPDEGRWAIRRELFGHRGTEFFRWQEGIADTVWPLALRGLPWPPTSAREAIELLQSVQPLLARRGGFDQLLKLVAAARRSLAHYLPPEDPALRQFIDGQLLISAQTTSVHANALYAAAALDLPRRGIVAVEGGMGGIAATLARAVESAGGRVYYRQRVKRVLFKSGKPVSVETTRGRNVPADLVIFNLPEPNIHSLLPDQHPLRSRLCTEPPTDGWGAFMLYLGVDAGVVPADFPLHHQLLSERPAGEGADLFLSISPAWDGSRAPGGMRAITISTHTKRSGWWELFESDRSQYDARVREVQERLLSGAERILPGLRDAVLLQLPGTPVTFQRFTQRAGGWVGGFPQTHLLRVRRPRLGKYLWRVGDSIFPGQSTAAVALGGLRVASAILQESSAALRRAALGVDQAIVMEGGPNR
jgi:C-3',4' desaturase CrtD